MSGSCNRLAALCGCLLWSAAAAALAETAAPPAARAFAAPPATMPAPPVSVTGLGQVTLALLLVLAAVFAFAWLLRRMRGLGNRVGGALDVLAEIPLGQKERAVLLKVGQTHILLGVAPGQVSTLHVLAEPIELKPNAPAAELRPSFKALMLRSLGR